VDTRSTSTGNTSTSPLSALLHSDVVSRERLTTHLNIISHFSPNRARAVQNPIYSIFSMLHSRGLSTAPINPLDGKLTDADTALLHDHNSSSESLPYWLVNLPRSQWTAECPSFLRDQSPKNIKCLSTPDHLYTRQNWDQVKEITS
jgi:hypothetical protein